MIDIDPLMNTEVPLCMPEQEAPLFSKTFSLDKEEEEEAPLATLPSPFQLAAVQSTPEKIAGGISQIAPLSTAVLEWVEQIGSVMTFMDHEGLKELSMTIEQEDSPFVGTKVVISEFNTAPKQFNINLISTAQAVELFKQYLPQLMTAFNKESYAFSVASINTAYLNPEELMLLKRRKVTKTEEKPA